MTEAVPTRVVVQFSVEDMDGLVVAFGETAVIYVDGKHCASTMKYTGLDFKIKADKHG
jgi:hypothetical protein